MSEKREFEYAILALEAKSHTDVEETLNFMAGMGWRFMGFENMGLGKTAIFERKYIDPRAKQQGRLAAPLHPDSFC